jgi:hypothetical protein
LISLLHCASFEEKIKDSGCIKSNSPKTIAMIQQIDSIVGTSSFPSTTSKRPMRYFFVIMACVFPILVVVGFTPSYMMVYSGVATLHWFAHVHGAIMSSWLLVFLVQSVLAAKGNLKFHRRLGLFSVGLGALVWLCMVSASIRGRLAYYFPKEDDVWDVLLIELYASSLFAIFFTWGILVRKNAAAHKRLILLATIIIMTAAVDRIQFLPVAGSMLRLPYLDALLIPLFIYDLATLKRIHNITLIGTAFIIVLQISITLLWGNPGWHTIAFNAWKPFVTAPVEVTLSDAEVAPLLGDYGDDNWHVKIEKIDGKVYFLMPGIPKKELGGTSPTEMFMRTMAWKMEFMKDADGKVTKIINTQPNIRWELQRYKPSL